MTARVLSMEARRDLVDAEAEALVLGGLIEAWDGEHGRRITGEVLAAVRAEDFGRRGHAEVFRAIRRLLQRDVPVSVPTVGRELADAGKLEAAGGLAALVGMQERAIGEVPSAPHLARRVAQLAARRALRETASGVARDAGERLDDPGFADELLARLLRAENGPRTAEVLSGADWVAQAWTALERRHQAREAPGVSVGLRYFDAAGGLERSEITVLAGRPGDGKTALGLRMALGAAAAGAEVLVISVEMSAEDLALRALAGAGGVLGARVRDPRRLSAEDFSTLARAVRGLEPGLERVRVVAPEPDRADVEGLVMLVRREHAVRPLDLVVLDYAQLVRAPGRTREEEVARVSRALKSTAKATGAAGLVLAQLNREIERRPDPIPQLSDLRESGQLEQDAGTVAVLSRYEKASGGAPVEHDDRRFVYVLKRRHGAARRAFALRFIADRGPWFEDLDETPGRWPGSQENAR